MSSISSNSPSINLFFFISFLFNLLDNFPKNSFLVNGNIKKNPNKSVAKPGMIKSIAAKAIAAPDTISYAGNWFFINPVVVEGNFWV